MSNIPSKTRFTNRDRYGALFYAMRMARDEKTIYILYYDYDINEWCVERYSEFVGWDVTAYEDKRYVLPHGEVTRLS